MSCRTSTGLSSNRIRPSNNRICWSGTNWRRFNKIIRAKCWLSMSSGRKMSRCRIRWGNLSSWHVKRTKNSKRWEGTSKPLRGTSNLLHGLSPNTRSKWPKLLKSVLREKIKCNNWSSNWSPIKCLWDKRKWMSRAWFVKIEHCRELFKWSKMESCRVRTIWIVSKNASHRVKEIVLISKIRWSYIQGNPKDSRTKTKESKIY